MPNYRPTTTGHQTKGKLGRYFEPSTMSAVMGIFGVSMLLTYVFGFFRHVSLAIVIPCFTIAPNAASLYVVFFLIQGKPRGHFRDWLRTHFLGVSSAQGWSAKDTLPPLDL